MSADPFAQAADDHRLVKHSLVLAGHRTSISLEGVFWHALRDETRRRRQSIAALVREWGGEPRILPIARDTASAIAHTLSLARGADLIVTIGGASVGDHDLAGSTLAAAGMKLAFWKIAMRPGKPLICGTLDGRLVLGLPGNSVSSFVCAHVFLRPALQAHLGLPYSPDVPRRAVLDEDIEANGNRLHYMRARLTGTTADGRIRVSAARSQDSSMSRLLAGSGALIARPTGDPSRLAGDEVDILLL